MKLLLKLGLPGQKQREAIRVCGRVRRFCNTRRRCVETGIAGIRSYFCGVQNVDAVLGDAQQKAVAIVLKNNNGGFGANRLPPNDGK